MSSINSKKQFNKAVSLMKGAMLKPGGGSMKSIKFNYPYKNPKKRKMTSSIVKNNQSKNVQEVKCRDQVFSPLLNTNLVAYTNVVYIEPTVAGLGLETGYSSINLVSQGTGINNRIANKVVVKSLRVQGQVAANDAMDLTDSGQVRLIIVYDKQTNKAAPGIADIIANIDTSGGYATAFNSHVRISNGNRFVILRDKIWQTQGLGGTNSFQIDEYIKVNMETTYVTTSTPPAITDVTTGGIYLLLFCNGALGFTHFPNYAYINVRMRYYDL
nr:MAG: capsid protein [Cressdnaviricota sp.]